MKIFKERETDSPLQLSHPGLDQSLKCSRAFGGAGSFRWTWKEASAGWKSRLEARPQEVEARAQRGSHAGGLIPAPQAPSKASGLLSHHRARIPELGPQRMRNRTFSLRAPRPGHLPG